MSKSVRYRIFVITLLSGLTLLTSGASAQKHDGDHESGEVHIHDAHNYHLGIGISGAYLTGEQMVAPGIDIHFLRQLGVERNWGIGIGYEVLLKDEIHNNITFMANIHTAKFLSINAGPGFNFGKHEGETEYTPALHAEAVFEFDVKKVHIGPVVGFGLDKDEAHFSLGVHLGYGF